MAPALREATDQTCGVCGPLPLGPRPCLSQRRPGPSPVSLSPALSTAWPLGRPPAHSPPATGVALTLCLSSPVSPFSAELRELVSTGSCNPAFNV